MESPEEKIILATIGCIEKYGMDKTTIRRIGAEAGMNSAAVSYYFRSKEVLMDRVLEIALGNAFDMENHRESVGLPPLERLSAVLDGMLDGAMRYPNLTRAFFSDLFAGRPRGTLMLQRCRAFLDTLREELAAAYPERAEAELGEALMAAASATFLFPGLFPDFFAARPYPELREPEARRAYVREVTEACFRERRA